MVGLVSMGALLGLGGWGISSVSQAGRPPFVVAQGGPGGPLPRQAWAFTLGLWARGFFFRLGAVRHACSLALAQRVLQRGHL
jgi:hypothetical protein